MGSGCASRQEYSLVPGQRAAGPVLMVPHRCVCVFVCVCMRSSLSTFILGASALGDSVLTRKDMPGFSPSQALIDGFQSGRSFLYFKSFIVIKINSAPYRI